MTDPDSALRAMLDAVGPLAEECVPIQKCAGRALASDMRAVCDLPLFDNSAMDGYAVRAADLRPLRIVNGSGRTAFSAVRRAREEEPVKLRVVGVIKAGGAASLRVASGQAAKIMTGAPLPAGADSVVPREFAREIDGRVEIAQRTEPGQYVRRRGMDVRRGSVAIRAGTVLRPYEIALLASQGAREARVIRRPRVAVLCSGDELVDFRRSPGPGQIRDSNGPALAALLEAWGYETLRLELAGDDPGVLGRLCADALRRCDVLLVSGGVSVGDFDHTRAVLEDLGLRTLLWRVKIKPGKPLLFGLWRGKPVFGLPGNPISSLVCCEVFARPVLEKMSGRRPEEEPFPLRGVLVKGFAKPESLRQYLFCSARRRGSSYSIEVLEPQGSGLVGMGSRANALAVGPMGTAVLERGMEVNFRWL